MLLMIALADGSISFSEAEKMIAQKIAQTPSAVKVKLSVSVSAGGNNQLQDSLGVTTTATAGGAQSEPDLP